MNEARLRIGIAMALLLAASGAAAATLRWAVRGDAESMDPHAFAESVTHNVALLVHDTLVERDRQQRFVPALAARWTMLDAKRWRFELRPGVRFQDGTPLDADDVVFSILRAQQPTSQYAVYAQPLGEPVRLDAQTLELRLHAPSPLVLHNVAQIMVMSRRWAEANRSTRVPDFKAREEAPSSRQAMGTGRYRLESREPGVRTVFVRNEAHWSAPEGNVDRLVLLPIESDATRSAALVAGDVDLVQDIPPQDAGRLARDPALRLIEGPENRVLYLGFDLARDQLLYGSVKERNPLKDVRVREAFALALDAAAIGRSVLHGRAAPTRCFAVDAAACRAPELESPQAPDLARARRLMAEAGYGKGFDLTLDCPSDRYVLGRAVCSAVGGRLARIGVRIQVDARPKSVFFPKMFRYDTSFYLAGVGGSVTDPQLMMDMMLHGADAASKKGNGNFGRIADDGLDRLIDAAGRETDADARTPLIRDVQRRIVEQHYVLPLWRPVISWAARSRVRAVMTPANLLRADWVRIDEGPP